MLLCQSCKSLWKKFLYPWFRDILLLCHFRGPRFVVSARPTMFGIDKIINRLWTVSAVMLEIHIQSKGHSLIQSILQIFHMIHGLIKLTRKRSYQFNAQFSNIVAVTFKENIFGRHHKHPYLFLFLFWEV